MNFENILRELRLMRAQPGHRFYTLVVLAIVGVLRQPVATILVAAFAVWLGTK